MMVESFSKATKNHWKIIKNEKLKLGKSNGSNASAKHFVQHQVQSKNVNKTWLMVFFINNFHYSYMHTSFPTKCQDPMKTNVTSWKLILSPFNF